MHFEPIPHILEVSKLSRIFKRGRQEIRAVDDINISIDRGEFSAITGASGSGKSTLLNLMAGFETPDSGKVRFENTALDTMNVYPISDGTVSDSGKTVNLDDGAIARFAGLPGVRLVYSLDPFTVTITIDSTEKSVSAQALSNQALDTKVFMQFEAGDAMTSDSAREALATRLSLSGRIENNGQFFSRKSQIPNKW